MLLSLFYFVKQFSTFQDVNAGSGLMGVVLQHVAMSIQFLYCGLEQCFLKIFESCSLEVVCLFFFFVVVFFPHIIFSPVLVCDLCTWKELFCFCLSWRHTEATSSFKHWKNAPASRDETVLWLHVRQLGREPILNI